MAYFSIENFCGGVESGLIWLTTGGFLKFYSGNTGNTERKQNTHMSTDGTKSALAWLTAGTSAVVCLGFAQTAGGRYRRPPSKKPKATDLTTAVDHGNMQERIERRRNKSPTVLFY